MSTFELGLQPSRTAVEGIGWAAKRSKWESLLVAVAYATTSGSQQLVGELDAQWEGFQDSKKVFLVGLDFGLTEPEAVDYLAALPGAIVRLWKPEQTIRANLKPARRYHPKVYALANTGSMRNATGAAGIVGSANLTGSGLTANIETFAAFDVSYVDEVGANWIAELRKLELIAAGMPKATEQILKQYALIRRRQPAFARGVAEPPPGVVGPREELPSELLRALRSARFFWTQTLNIIPNRGRGRAGNQVDLKKGARAFFGSRVPLSEPINTPLADIEIVKRWQLGAVPCSIRPQWHGQGESPDTQGCRWLRPEIPPLEAARSPEV